MERRIQPHSLRPARIRPLLGILVGLMGLLTACATIESDSPKRPTPGRKILASLSDCERLLERSHRSILRHEAARAAFEAAKRSSILFFDQVTGDSATRERARQIHNESLERFLKLTRGGRKNLGQAWRREVSELGVSLTVQGADDSWHQDEHSTIEFASDHTSRGIRSPVRSEGIGVPVFAVRKRAADAPERLNGSDRFLPPIEVHPLTLVMRHRPEQNGLTSIEMVDPLLVTSIETRSEVVSLAYDLSKPLAYQFHPLRKPIREWVMSLDPHHLDWSLGLYLLHPYQRGKIPVILVHGYGVNSACWLQTINELLAVPRIRDRYQFLVFEYPSINPFLHTTALLRQSVRDFRQTFDPEGSDLAMKEMVLIGHSMGGVMAKTLAQNSGESLWSLVSLQPIDRLRASSEDRDLLEKVFHFEADPSIARLVFIATPHHGTRFSNRSFGRISAALTPHPGRLAEAYENLRRANPPNSFSPLFVQEGLAVSFDQFELGNPVLETLVKLPIAEQTTTHSIIAQKHSGPIENGSDGIVDYQSSHLDGVASEIVIRHHHFSQDAPATIEQLKRILD